MCSSCGEVIRNGKRGTCNCVCQRTKKRMKEQIRYLANGLKYCLKCHHTLNTIARVVDRDE